MSEANSSDGHVFRLRVYFEDTDAGGIVYHASYIRFMERARTEFLRHLGFSQRDISEREGVWFAVKSLEMNFIKPARLDDELDIVTHVENMAGASLSFSQILYRDDERLVAGLVQIACIDREGRVRRVPTNIRQILHAHVAQPPQS